MPEELSSCLASGRTAQSFMQITPLNL